MAKLEINARKEEILKQLKSLQIININGIQYLGKIKKEAEVVSVTEAVDITDCPNFDQAAKRFIKTSNLEQLSEIELGGQQSYSLKKLTAEQLDEAEILAIKVSRLSEKAMAELINSKF